MTRCGRGQLTARRARTRRRQRAHRGRGRLGASLVDALERKCRADGASARPRPAGNSGDAETAGPTPGTARRPAAPLRAAESRATVDARPPPETLTGIVASAGTAPGSQPPTQLRGHLQRDHGRVSWAARRWCVHSGRPSSASSAEQRGARRGFHSDGQPEKPSALPARATPRRWTIAARRAAALQGRACLGDAVSTRPLRTVPLEWGWDALYTERRENGLDHCLPFSFSRLFASFAKSAPQGFAACVRCAAERLRGIPGSRWTRAFPTKRHPVGLRYRPRNRVRRRFFPFAIFASSGERIFSYSENRCSTRSRSDSNRARR